MEKATTIFEICGIDVDTGMIIKNIEESINQMIEANHSKIKRIEITHTSDLSEYDIFSVKTIAYYED